MPPLPAHVMMWESGKPVTVGDLADAVPVGRVAREVRHQDRAGLGTDHRFDGVDVDVEGVRLDIDEYGHESGPDERREVGGERQG